MNIFEDLGKKVTETVDSVNKKSTEFIEVQKLKAKISNTQVVMEDNFKDLGRMLYERYEAGEVMEEKYLPYCEGITKCQESIRQYKKEINEWKKIDECEVCGEIIKKDAVYCPKCGNKIER
jgi:hypothetical protein